MIPRLAVLIDADNISADYAPAIFERVATLGVAAVRRLYGKPASIASWEIASLHEVYELRPQVSITSAKNGADIALAVGAMDILHAEWVDAFCIVSNDRDFVPLALRLRASRKEVHAIGTQFDARLQKVFDSVFELLPVKPAVTPNALSAVKAPANSRLATNKSGLHAKAVTVPSLVAAFRMIVSTNKDEFGLSEAGKLLREVAPPDVVPPPGKGRLRKALEKTEQFVFTGSGPSTRVRLKANVARSGAAA